MPLAIDVEEWRNHSGGVTGEIILQLHAMVDYLRAAGHHVIIYTNKGGHRRFIRGHFDDTGLWVCSFTDPPISRADGVAGPVDLNTFCGDSAAWRTALSRWAGQ